MLDLLEEISFDALERIYVGGQWRPLRGVGRATIVNPSSEKIVARLPLAGHADVTAAVAAARSAFDDGPWPNLAGAERSACMHGLADLLAERLEMMARLWTFQVGMPIAPASRIVRAGIERLRFYADLAGSFDFETNRVGRQGPIRVRHEPAGVAALIIPWNASFPIMMQKLGAALAAGCCCIVKPAVESPLEALVLAECVARSDVPPGVVNVVVAGPEESAALVSSRDVEKVSFTGSIATGRAIALAAARNFTRVTLELGGKSAAILLDDADLPQSLSALTPFMMPFSGQFCFSQSRILAPRSRLPEVVEQVKAIVEAFRLGDPAMVDTDLGPVLSDRQRQRVLNYIEGARADGARVVAGGGRSTRFERGFYVEPTVIDNVAPQMAIAREEVFGPVVTVHAFDTDADAVALANATEMGLSGSVFSADPDRAYEVACGIRTGQVGINRLALEPGAPFGGFKSSGVGREGGVEGLVAFTETKALFI